MKTAIYYLILFVLLLAIVPSRPVDFTAVYHGVTALSDNESPYDMKIAEQNQRFTYGRLALDGEDQMRIAHPLTSLLLLYPLAWFELQTAKAIFIAGSALLLISGVHQLGAKWWWSVLVCILLREPVAAFMLGQIALLSSACVVWALVFAKRRQNRAAQLMMVIASVHPILSVPIALLTLKKRSLYVSVLSLLFCLSLCIDWQWPLKWLSVARAYPGYVNYMVWLPQVAPILAFIGIALLFMRNFTGSLTGLTLLMPLTGAYHLTLYAPVFSKPTYVFLVFALLIWFIPLFPISDRKVISPLLFVCFALLSSNSLQHWLYEQRSKLRADADRRAMHGANVVRVASDQPGH